MVIHTAWTVEQRQTEATAAADTFAKRTQFVAVENPKTCHLQVAVTTK
jgi:hypothetical protein